MPDQKPDAAVTPVEVPPLNLDVPPPEPPKPTSHDLSVAALDLVQRLNGQIHHVTQVDSKGGDSSLEKALVKKTRAALDAACEAAGM